MSRTKLRKTLFLLSVAGILGACSNILSACSNNGTIGANGSANLEAVDVAAPVRLNATAPALSPASQSVIMPVDQAVAAKAIENYRILKGGNKGPYEYKGADLNADGTPELLVYLTGDGWCAKTGCTLAVLQADAHGYKPVSTIKRVKRPVRVSAKTVSGWRSLLVNTGGAGMPLQTVALQFSGRGYPGNATLIAPIPTAAQMGGETLFDFAQKSPSIATQAFQLLP